MLIKDQSWGYAPLKLHCFYRSIKNVEKLDLSWEKNRMNQNTERNWDSFETKNCDQWITLYRFYEWNGSHDTNSVRGVTRKCRLVFLAQLLKRWLAPYNPFFCFYLYQDRLEMQLNGFSFGSWTDYSTRGISLLLENIWCLNCFFNPGLNLQLSWQVLEQPSPEDTVEVRKILNFSYSISYKATTNEVKLAREVSLVRVKLKVTKVPSY